MAERNPASVKSNESDFLRLGDENTVGQAIAMHQGIPGLVGFWPMSSVQRSTGNVYDLSGQGRTLTLNGSGALFNHYNGFVPYVEFSGSSEYLSRADETDLDIIGNEAYFSGNGGLTMGGWFWFDVLGTPSVTNRGCMGKFASSGQYSYVLYLYSESPVIIGLVSNDGTNAPGVQHTTTISINTWYFLCLRFVPGTSIDVWVNTTKVSNTSSVPSTLFNGTSAFEIGRVFASQLLNGKASMCFLSAHRLTDNRILDLYYRQRKLFGHYT